MPSLRNVTLTAPYGHSGAYDTLESMVRHHLDTTRSLHNYNPALAVLPLHPDPSVADADLLGDDVTHNSSIESRHRAN